MFWSILLAWVNAQILILNLKQFESKCSIILIIFLNACKRLEINTEAL